MTTYEILYLDNGSGPSTFPNSSGNVNMSKIICMRASGAHWASGEVASGIAQPPFGFISRNLTTAESITLDMWAIDSTNPAGPLISVDVLDQSPAYIPPPA